MQLEFSAQLPAHGSSHIPLTHAWSIEQSSSNRHCPMTAGRISVVSAEIIKS